MRMIYLDEKNILEKHINRLQKFRNTLDFDQSEQDKALASLLSNLD